MINVPTKVPTDRMYNKEVFKMYHATETTYDNQVDNVIIITVRQCRLPEFIMVSTLSADVPYKFPLYSPCSINFPSVISCSIFSRDTNTYSLPFCSPGFCGRDVTDNVKIRIKFTCVLGIVMKKIDQNQLILQAIFHLQGTGVTYFSGSVAMSLLRNSFLPTPGAPTKTIGLISPGLGYNRATSSYVGIISRSKSSFSVIS